MTTYTPDDLGRIAYESNPIMTASESIFGRPLTPEPVPWEELDENAPHYQSFGFGGCGQNFTRSAYIAAAVAVRDAVMPVVPEIPNDVGWISSYTKPDPWHWVTTFFAYARPNIDNDPWEDATEDRMVEAAHVSCVIAQEAYDTGVQFVDLFRDGDKWIAFVGDVKLSDNTEAIEGTGPDISSAIRAAIEQDGGEG